MHALLLLLLAGGTTDVVKVEGSMKFESDQVLAVVDGQAIYTGNPCLDLKPGAKGWALVVHIPNAPEPSGQCQAKKLEPEGEYIIPAGKVKFLGHTAFAYAGELTLNPESEVKPHQHDGSDEFVVILSGTGTFTVAGEKREVKAGDVMHIVKGTQHGFVAGKQPVKALQFYTPPGPEERFRKK